MGQYTEVCTRVNTLQFIRRGGCTAGGGPANAPVPLANLGNALPRVFVLACAGNVMQGLSAAAEAAAAFRGRAATFPSHYLDLWGQAGTAA